MSKSIAQHLEETRKDEPEEGLDPGTIMIVDGSPYIYLRPGERPYFKEVDGQIVIL